MKTTDQRTSPKVADMGLFFPAGVNRRVHLKKKEDCEGKKKRMHYIQ